MSLRIEVYVPEGIVADGYAGKYLAKALSAVGFERPAENRAVGGTTLAEAEARFAATVPASPNADPVPQDGGVVGDATGDGGTQKPEEPKAEPARRGRRSKAEIDAANTAEQAAKNAAAVKPNISTGGERVDPENPEDTAQDAADEAAEVEAARDEKAPLTIDDVKQAVGLYVAAYGMAAVQEDGPKIFVEALGAPPAGEAYWKMSIIPDDQAVLAQAVAVWRKATELNPLKRAKVS